MDLHGVVECRDVGPVRPASSRPFPTSDSDLVGGALDNACSSEVCRGIAIVRCFAMTRPRLH